MDSPSTLVRSRLQRSRPAAERGRRTRPSAGGAGRRLTPRAGWGTSSQERESEPPAIASPARGALLAGRYRLLERLGAGGFGVVWRADDQLLEREVAVKRIPLEPLASGEEDPAGRAGREARAAARLSHPAIAALYEAFAEDDSLYLVSELVPGAPLHVCIADAALSDREVIAVGSALCEALEHAHSRGVVHRDVKPANVIVTPPGSAHGAPAKLTDFGSALIGDGHGGGGGVDDRLTRTGDVVGTLAYMAPEQADGLRAGPATDLFALALVLYEALSGTNPQRGPNAALTARRLGMALPPLSAHRRDLPKTLSAAIDRALDADPQRRGTVADLRRALEQTHVRARGRRLRQRIGGRPSQAAPSAATDRLGLPRAIWWACALALVVWQGVAGHAGTAVVLAACATPLLLLPRRCGPLWLTALLAPALGMVGLAGSFPAIAAQPSRWLHRAALAALGYWWLLLAQPLLSRRLWLWPPGGRAAAAAGTLHVAGLASSPVAATNHVLTPVFTLATIAGALLWALAATLLPWLVRGRSLVRDILALTPWVALLASAEPLLGALRSAHPVTPRGALLGSLLAGVIAIFARALRGPG